MGLLIKRKKWKYKLLIHCLVLVLICIFSFTIGPADISFREAAAIIFGRMPVLKNWIDLEQYSPVAQTIIWSLRMPRVILAALVGGALGVTGGAFQAFFKNPLADPYVIGVSSGAALGATVGIVSGTAGALGLMRIPLFSFLGALLTTWIVYSLAKSYNRIVASTLLLAGVALNSFMSAIMSFLMVINAEKIERIFLWLMGSFANRTWQHVLIAAPLIFVGVLILFSMAKELNAMVFGDSTAQHLGIDLRKIQIILLLAASLTAAGAVAICGTIGFVGLIIPHIARLLAGPDHRILLPFSFLLGGTVMVVADTLARTLFEPLEIPIGIITALFGGPFFIYLLKKKKAVSL
ncbi:MAG: iron ABC transporter permease [Peptococcaceae bacterium]|nr:iron ABC transporter permease [Peptococcaceae bacterium]